MYKDEDYTLLKEGYSFPMHDRICTCNGIFKRDIIEPRARDREPISHSQPAPIEGSWMPDTAMFHLENGKAAARNKWRKQRGHISSHVKAPRKSTRKSDKQIITWKRNVKVKPQSGSDEVISKADTVKLVIAGFSRIYSMYHASSLFHFLTIVLDMLREFIPESTCAWLRESFEELLENKSFTLEEFSEYCMSSLKNWQSFTTHTLFPIFSELMNVVAIAILTPSELLPKLLHIRADLFRYVGSYRSHAADILDWMVKTFTSLVSTLKIYSETSSITEALCLKTTDQVMADIYNNCATHYPGAKNGNLDGTITNFGAICTEAVSKLESMRYSLHSSDIRVCQNYIARIQQLDLDISSRNSGECFRVQPFAFTLTGGTGVGKSNLSTPLIQHVLKCNGFPIEDRNIAAINLRLKFWDNVTNSTLGYKFDDPDFLLEAKNTVDYLTPLGRVLNNEQFVLDKAEIPEKGRVFCNCKAANLTSNDSEYGVYNLAKEPAAIFRRFQSHISISVKPDFCKKLEDGIRSSEMDSKLVAAKFPDEVYPDVFNITVYQVIVKGADASKYKSDLATSTTNHIADQYCFAPVEWEGKLLVDIGIRTLLRYLTASSKAWFHLQNALVARKKEQAKQEYACDVCMDPLGCSCGMAVPDGQKPGTYNPPSHDVPILDIPWDPIIYGRIPEKTKPGSYPCNVCNNSMSASSLWFYKIDSDTRSCCRACLAVSRINCQECLNLQLSEVGMRRQPSRVIKCTEYCKCCYEIGGEHKGVSPEAGELNDLYDSVTRVLEHSARTRLAEDVYSTHLRDLLQSYFTTGTSNVMQLFSQLDSTFSTESAYFINQIVDHALSYLKSIGLDKIEMWIPRNLEGSAIGSYIHSRTSVVKKVSAADRFLSVLTGILGVASIRYGSLKYFTVPLGLYCSYTKGHPVSILIPWLVRLLKKYDIKKFLKSNNLSKFKDMLKILLVCCVSTKYNWFLPLACAGFAYRSHKIFSIGEMVSNEYASIKDEHPLEIRDVYLPDILKAAAVQRLMSALCFAIHGLRFQVGIRPQSGQLSIQDYASLDGMAKYWYKKQWHDVNLDPLPVNNHSVAAETKNLVCKNLLYVRNVTTGQCCDAFAITSKKILVPHHMVSRGRAHYKFTRKNDISGMCGNAHFKAHFSLADTRYVGGDMVVVDVPKAGDFKDMSSLFLNDLNRVPREAIMIHRNKDGFIDVHEVYDIVHEISTNNHVIDGSKVHFDGISYSSSGVGPTKCMSVIVAVENPSAILGFHLGGSNTGVGIACVYTRHDIEKFQKAHNDCSSVVVVPESGTFRQQQYGVNCIIQGVHPNSIACAMEPGEYKLFGSTGNVSKDTDDIIQTPISEKVREVMGCTTKWGPPKLKGTGPESDRKQKWLAMLGANTNTAEEIPIDLLNQCVTDYLQGFEELIKEHPPEIIRPLSDEEVVTGIPGVDFIESMDPNTSVGFPLGGNKRKYMEQRYDEATGTWRNVFVTDMFHKSARLNESEYIAGRRVYPVYKTFSKIEPVDVEKDKVRMVNGAPLDKQISMRKFALPILKYLSDHSDHSECSVGINPYGKAWGAKYYRLKNFGGCNRIIALDHKNYDLKMTAQLVGAAFNVIIRIAEMFGYSECEIAILRGLAADTMWPTICVNGDILMLFGSTVSGHNATVYINCIINSLMMRASFYTSYPGGYLGWLKVEKFSFREAVCLSVYGDDLVGSVDKRFSKFNNRSILANLAEYGFTLTAYDKSPIPKVYDNLHEVEFLKRKFLHSSNLKTIAGPLNENSIFKRLCCIHKPKAPNTMETILSSNIDSALAEWFYYGPDTYNQRLAQMGVIIDSIPCPILASVCRGVLSKSYEDRLATWNSLYNK
jgi:hypothetical protein